MNSKVKYPVLVVDDEEDLRDLIAMTLMKMGLEVDTASGVIEAKNKLGNKKNCYSLVLTDMRMPDGTGLEIVEYISKNNFDLPIAVITAYGNSDNAVEALKRGAFDYLQKPITLAQLRTLVKSAITVDDEPKTVMPPPTPKVPPDETSVQTQKEDNPNKRYGDIEFDMSFLNKENEQGKTKEVPAKEQSIHNRLYLSSQKAEKQEAPIPEPIAEKCLAEPSPDKQGHTLPDSVSSKKENETPAKSPDIESALLPRLMGESAAMKEVKAIIIKLSRTIVPVYISGESGTGKEQAARSIHELSERRHESFVPVNCGAIPENLMESEFFGYKKGSFTGADADKEGFFQHAHKGTIFLDEVADLPLTMQVKLLRVIQEKMVRRIGENKETPIDVRILCATHKNLEKEVAEGRFRQDLYYRLNVITLSMPPLRELKEDLPKLIARLLKKFSPDFSVKLLPDALKMLLNYDYPGNFRELENILERAVALCSNNSIHADDLQLRASVSLNAEERDSMRSLEQDDPQNQHDMESLLKGEVTLQDILDKYEKDILVKALERAKYNRTQAAKLLGISFRSIRYRLERLGIE